MSDTPETLQLSLSIPNSFSFPKSMDIFGREVAAMSTRLEESQDYTEEDALIVHSLEGDFEASDSVLAMSWWRKTLGQLSTDFPELLFALDVKGVNSDVVRRREYFLDGQLQVALPVQVIPDFDEDGPTVKADASFVRISEP